MKTATKIITCLMISVNYNASKESRFCFGLCGIFGRKPTEISHMSCDTPSSYHTARSLPNSFTLAPFSSMNSPEASPKSSSSEESEYIDNP